VTLNYLFFHHTKHRGRSTLEFDVFIPELSLAFEYNGKYHYQWIPIFDELSSVQERDAFKRSVCQEAGITLIVIPYWWNNDIDSLVHTIRNRRPDLTLPHFKITKKEGIPEHGPQDQTTVIYTPKGIPSISNTINW